MQVMEPNLPTPYPSPEMDPSNGAKGEKLSPKVPEQIVSPRPEAAPISRERQGLEQQQGQSSGGDPAWQASAIAVPAVDPQSPPVVASSTAVTDDNPLTAGDEDLIEQEWVQKAKKIVASTKNDPYLQEKEVSKLQADYLQKRYGKEVKLPND
jgi:hypothetical protein